MNSWFGLTRINSPSFDSTSIEFQFDTRGVSMKILLAVDGSLYAQKMLSYLATTDALFFCNQ
jgi:hypothetical protein